MKQKQKPSDSNQNTTPDNQNSSKILKNYLFNIAASLKFKTLKNSFQEKMKKDISNIKSSKDIHIFADKTNNIYKLSPNEYTKLLNENITKTYEKATNRLEKSINMEAKCISKTLDLSDRIECLSKNSAFITI